MIKTSVSSSGLKNDSTPEVFELKHKTQSTNEDFPVLFIQGEFSGYFI